MKKTFQKMVGVGLVTLSLLGLAACGSDSTSSSPKLSSSSKAALANKSSSTSKSSTTEKTSSSQPASSSRVPKSSSTANSSASASNQTVVLKKLVTYTNEKSPGPNKDYYWQNGAAQLTGFEHLAAGKYSFSGDAKGRSSVARTVLTYAEFAASKGGRQGAPLDPPAWPENPKVAITFSLTQRTYHGYLYNRSHSIADSLLGAGSYTSAYNFTTGTRSQNVGADQNGGMRAAEEMAENYWKSHPQTKNTIQYQTTPLYQGNETIPRGSLVDLKSSDQQVNAEIVVINDAEGISINYASGSSQATSSALTENKKSSSTSHQPAASQTAPKTSSSSAVTSQDSQTVYVVGNGTTKVYWYSKADIRPVPKNPVISMTEAQAIARGLHHSQKEK